MTWRRFKSHFAPVGRLKNSSTTIKFGNRLRSLRLHVDLSQDQMYYATGISQSHIARIELAQLSTSLHHVGIFADFFGIDEYELLQFESPLPDVSRLKKGITQYLKSKGIDPTQFAEKQGAVHIVENKVLPSRFLATPKYTKEIADYCVEKFDAKFTTSQLSKALKTMVDRKLLVRKKTSKRSKYQYFKN